MDAELLAAVLIGLLAVGSLLSPLIWPRPEPTEASESEAAYVEFEETARGQALLALKEIEFDRATGKLSERDYEELKTKYTARAVALLEAESAAETSESDAGGRPVPACPACGPRPEPDAFICSTCGLPLPAVLGCSGCGNRLPAASRFCDRCGAPTAGEPALTPG